MIDTLEIIIFIKKISCYFHFSILLVILKDLVQTSNMFNIQKYKIKCLEKYTLEIYYLSSEFCHFLSIQLLRKK